MSKHRFILPRVKEAFEVLKDIADYNPSMLDRDTISNIYNGYKLDKVWLKNENKESPKNVDTAERG